MRKAGKTVGIVAKDPRVQALFRGEPRGFSQTHYNAFEPRLDRRIGRQVVTADEQPVQLPLPQEALPLRKSA